MVLARGSPQYRGASCAAVLLAILGVVTGWGVLWFARPYPIADEAGQHLPVIKRFFGGDWRLPEHLPMPPTYHAAATVAARTLGATLPVLRGFSTALGVLAILIVALLTRHRHFVAPNDALWHFACLPILFPFWSLVYTESMAIFFLAGGLLLHILGRRWSAAGMVLLACAVRQSNVVWAVFLAGWAVLERSADGAGSRRRWWNALGGYGLVVLLAVGLLVWHGRLTVAPVEANRLRFNVAQWYSFALFVMVLWAPVWVLRFREDVIALRQCVTGRPGPAVVLFVGLGFLFVVLTLAFDNPHPWNQDPRFVRNWSLLAMDEHVSARLGAAGASVWVAVSAARLTWCSANRRALTLAWGCTVAYLLPHSLVEPRYYIVPMVLLNVLADHGHRQARALTVWYGFLCVGIMAYIAMQGDATGGIW